MGTPTEIDSLPVSSLPDRYGVARSQIYNRLNKLNLQTQKRGNKAYVNAQQIAQLDDIHQLITQGLSLDEAVAQMQSNSDPPITPQDSPTRQSHETSQDSLMRQSYDLTGQLDLRGLLGAIAPQTQPSDPLALFRNLEDIAKHGWILSTSQLADIIGIKPKGQTFDRFGFRFTRSGKNGSETAWKVEKI